jgi:hypothetical protein
MCVPAVHGPRGTGAAAGALARGAELVVYGELAAIVCVRECVCACVCVRACVRLCTTHTLFI